MKLDSLLLTTLLLAQVFASTASAVQQRVFFAPSATDPAITQFNDNHYAVVDPAVTNRGRLVLFLPGTGGTPSEYCLFPQNAASLGFHSLGLMYPNASAINILCALYAPYDGNAAGNARLEVIDGTNRVSFLSVDSTNCIQSRLLKALQYLNTTYPTRGWGQYYSGSTLLWSKLIVSGHSQGAGMAAMLAKTRVTARCVMFSDMDWWKWGNQPYNWMSTTPQTPVNYWYLFAHERDELLDFTEMQTCAAALDVSRYGAYVQVETATSASYSGRHFLSTNLDPSSAAQTNPFHRCTVFDGATPMQADGVTPVFKPVWDYMLLHDTAPITIESASANISVIFSPGTLEQSDDLTHWTPQTSATSPLTLSLGTLPPRRFYRLGATP